MIDLLLKIILLVSPLAYCVNLSLDNFDFLLFRIGIMCLFFVSTFSEPVRIINKKYLWYPITSLFTICLLNLFWNKFNPISVSNTTNLFFGILAIYIITRYVNKPKEIYSFIVLAVLINIFIFIFQKFGYNPILNTSFPDEVGANLGSAPRFAMWLGLICPILFSYSKLFFPLIVLIAIGATELSLLGIAVLVFIVMTKNKLYKLLLGVGLIIGILIFHKQLLASCNVRIDFWRNTIEYIVKRPLLGYGLGIGLKDSGFANIFIQLCFQLGILGFAWLQYWIYQVKHKFNTSIESLCLISFLLLSLIEYPIEIPRLWFYIISIISFFIIHINKEEQNEPVK